MRGLIRSNEPDPWKTLVRSLKFKTHQSPHASRIVHFGHLRLQLSIGDQLKAVNDSSILCYRFGDDTF
jgi:hypothetical protein